MSTETDTERDERRERRRKKREANRLYILPGQGRGAKHRRRMIRLKAFITAILLAALFGGALWLYYNRNMM